MTTARTSEPWTDIAALASLHSCSTQVELEQQFGSALERLLPGVDLLLCLADDAHGGLRVQVVIGSGWGLAEGNRLAAGSPALPAASCLPIRFGDHVLGTVMLGQEISSEDGAMLAAAIAHFGVALGNLALNGESRRSTDQYCASLQALEQGIVLFQEQDPEAVMAGLLSLATRMVGANAGCLYVLREVGDVTSGLCLEQALGIPDSLLATFRSADGSPWPDGLLGQQAQLATPQTDGSMAMLAPESVPAVLENLVIVPLRYHGVEAGVCLLFNANLAEWAEHEHLSRVQSLGQLGAALLHRLRLEALQAQNRSRERELEIASAIQKRFVPTAAPATPGLTFAWCAFPAQNIGGDYVDVFSLDSTIAHTIVADASGHGINSALLMSSCRSTYRANAPRVPIAELAASLNNHVASEVGSTGMFITAAIVQIDTASRRLRMTSAGHTPTLFYRARTGEVELLESNGPPFGFMQGADYTTYEAMLEPGDVLLLYTDGITEAANAELDMFGEDRLVEVVRCNPTASPEELLAAARRSLDEFVGKQHIEDDVSMVVIRVTA